MTAFLASLVDFIGAHPLLAIVIVFLVSACEAIFLIGLFVPSTVVLVGAGTLIGMGQLALWPILVASILGAIAGDGVSFWIGHVYKQRLRQVWPFAHYRVLIDQGERFFLSHGGKSIFIARFLPGVKSVVPVIAGMMGMGVWRFSVVNVVSAIAWSAAHILPGIGLGRGVSVFGSGNPRLVALALIVVVLALLAWYGVRLSVLWLGPGVARVHRETVTRLAQSRATPIRLLHRLLTNEGQIVVAVAWSVVALLGAFGFGAVALSLLFEPELAVADRAISNLFQSLRSEPADAIIVAITMIGDSLVLTAVSVTLVAAFVFHRRWRAGAAVALALIGAALFVPLIKSILQRPRPTALYSGADAFSFPSGHATLSMTVFGVIAVVLADGRPPRTRLLIYLAAVLLVGTIALSRVYLGAHWPSDVLAGALFGLAMVSIVAFLLHNIATPLPARSTAIALLVVFVAVYGFDLARNYRDWTDAYARVDTPVFTTEADWLQSGWRSLPMRRIELDGETGEAFLLQTDVPVAKIATALESSGWHRLASPSLLDAALILVPSREGLLDQLPIPSLNDGRRPILTLVRIAPDDAGRRYVLRFWDSGTAVGTAGSSTPILLGSVSVETEEPWAFGLFTLDPGRPTAEERAGIVADIADPLRRLPSVEIRRAGEVPFLAAGN